jgi:hypothetical protein
MRPQATPASRPSDVASTWPPVSPQALHGPARHHGLLDGATVTGEASRRNLTVRVGLWLDEAGAVRKARWRGVADESLRATAESACALLESGSDPGPANGAALRATLLASSASAEGADLVASAVEVALMADVSFGAG